VTKRAFAIAAALAAVMLGPTAVRAAEPAVTRAPVPAIGAESYPTATDVRVGGDAKLTRFVMDFDRRIDLATFTLADPYRVVIDLPQVIFKLPANAGEEGRGLVKEFRYGLIMRGGSRIVLDTNGPVHIDKAFAMNAAEGQPARLVVELSPIGRQSFLRNISLQDHMMHVRTGDSRDNSVSAQPEADSDPRPLIVLDPGHGGIDSGTKSYDGKYNEKDIVLAFGLLLREKLLKTGKYRVAMTRTDDTFIPLDERTRFARARKAALFISIHADSLPRSEGIADGASVYTLSEHASDAEAARLADTENKSDVIAGVDLSAEPNDVASILIDLAQRETKMFSLQFARTLVNELKPTTRLHLHPVKSAGFIVLKSPDVPSVLVELGYMSTKADLENLLSPAWRSRTADSMVQAINTFFAPRLAGRTSVGMK
jgi:N-acetylmuramoyl-L-alanine amidase